MEEGELVSRCVAAARSAMIISRRVVDVSRNGGSAAHCRVALCREADTQDLDFG